MLPMLKTGCLAYFDSFKGLIRCRVVSVTASKATGRVLKDSGAYKKGENVETTHLHMVPVQAIIRGKFNNKIGNYDVEVDAN